MKQAPQLNASSLRAPASSAKRAIWIVPALVALALIPSVVTSNYIIHVFINTALFLLLALSYDLVVGHVGLLSLAHPAFFGIGAYTVAIMAGKAGWMWSFPLLAAAAAIVAVVAGIVIGIPSLRLSSRSFAIGTLGFAMVAEVVANNWISVTEGPMCIVGIPPARLTVFGQGMTISTVPQYYFLIMVLAVGAMFAYERIVHGRIGRSFRAVRQDEALAAAFGINPQRYKLTAFLIGAGAASVAGAFYAHYSGVVCPDELSIMYTINLLIILFGGGTASLLGISLGAVVFTALPELLRFSTDARMTIYGAMLLVIVLFYPGGLRAMAEALMKAVGNATGAARGSGGDG